MIDLTKLQTPDLILDANHRYWLNGEEYTSTTALIDQYKQPFDEDKKSRDVAEREGVEQGVVLERWEKRRREAVKIGSSVHFGIDLWVKGDYPQFWSVCMGSIGAGRCGGYLGSFSNLTRKFPWISFGHSEIQVFSPKHKTAGTIDWIGYNVLYPLSENGTLGLIDWKTSEKIDPIGFGNMKPPVDHLFDCNWNHYALQMTMYKLILEESGVRVGWMKLVHLRPGGTYEVHEVKGYEKYAKDILKTQRYYHD